MEWRRLLGEARLLNRRCSFVISMVPNELGVCLRCNSPVFERNLAES